MILLHLFQRDARVGHDASRHPGVDAEQFRERAFLDDLREGAGYRRTGHRWREVRNSPVRRIRNCLIRFEESATGHKMAALRQRFVAKRR